MQLCNITILQERLKGEKMNIQNLEASKTNALAVYKLAKAAFMETVSRENIKGDWNKWVEFKNAERDCRLLGVRI